MQKLTTLAFLLGGLSTVAIAQPVNVQDQQQWLLEQVRIGEALYREDLVRHSLARLSLIAPNNPQALVASIRQALLDKIRGWQTSASRNYKPSLPILQHCARPRA